MRFFIKRQADEYDGSGGLRVKTGIRAGDPGTGGGGAGGGAGGSVPGLNDEQFAALEQRVAAIANAAVSSRMGKLEKNFDTKFAEFGKLVEGLKAPPPPDPDEGGKGKGKQRGDDVELQTLKAKIEASRLENDQLRQRFEAERTKVRTGDLRKFMTAQLAAIGITDPINQGLAMASLVADNVVGYESDDSDRVVWRDLTGEIDASMGFQGWKKTPVAQRLMPAPKTGGPGARGGHGQNGGGGQLSPEDAQAALWNRLADEL